MDNICPRCGAQSSKRRFVGNFCAECYSERIKLEVPLAISIPKCRLCERVRLKEWILSGEKGIGDFVLSKVKGKYSSAKVDFGAENSSITFLVNEGGSSIELRRDFSLEFTGATCPDCSRKTGGYYEAIIQLRGKPEKIEKTVIKLGKRLDISKTEELKEGLDLYAISKEKTHIALSALRLSFTTSNKLFGLKEGQRIYRTTFCVRL